MSKIIKRSYIFIILGIFYMPLFFGAVFSFNKPPERGDISFRQINGWTWRGFTDLFSSEIGASLLNSLVIGLIAATFVSLISLLTVYGLWYHRSRITKSFVDTTSNIPLINPEIVSAISLVITFSAIFGFLGFSDSGLFRAILAHIAMILPYGIIIMYPRSAKFQKSLLEASYDIGYGPFKTWFNTYVNYMKSLIFAVFFVALTLSFDDFIFTRVISKTETIGTKLYSSNIKNWILMLGTITLTITLIGSFIFVFKKGKRNG